MTSPSSVAPPRLQGLPHAVRDTAVIVRRNALRYLRLPQLVLFATVQPVMFLVLFNYVFGGSIAMALPGGLDYLDFLLPGLMVQTSVFGASQTAVGLTDDLKNGVIDRFRSLPMARSAVLAGRTLADLLRNTFVIALMVVVGFVLGFRPVTGLAGLVAGFLIAMAFAYAFSWVMATVGLAVKDPEATQTAAFLPLFPLVFASSIFSPTENMPDWLAAFAEHQPVSVVANAVRGLILGEDFLTAGLTSTVLTALAWIVGLTAVFAPLAVRMYRRAVN